MNKSATLALLLTTAFSCAALGALSGEWPQWRGPNRDGKSIETGLLKDWPAGGPPLVWKATGLGGGYSGVAVVGDRIYTQGEKGEANNVLALDRSKGQVLWSTKLGKPGAPGWGGFAGPRGTPTVDGDLLYAVTQYGEFGCFEAATGREVWHKDYAKDFGSERPEWGFSGSPLIEGDQVIVAPGGADGAVVALDKRSGKVAWRSQGLAEAVHYSSLIAVEIGGVRQFILLTDKTLAGLAAKDGKVLWSAPRKGSTAVIPDPIYSDGFVYVTSGYNAGCNLFAVSSSVGQFSARQVYANKVLENHHGGVVKLGDFLYGHSEKGGWTCQKFQTGEAAWQSKKLGKGSILYADGRLVLREEAKGKGAVALLEPSSSGYVEHGRFTPPNQSGKDNWPHPIIAGGKLYLRDQDVLLCYDVKAK